MAARKAVVEELSRERILQVARDLFATQGYRNVSMRSIAKELGYSHGAIYYHFKEKAELFCALIMEDFNMLSSMFQHVLSVHNKSAMSKVEQVLLEFIKFGLEFRHHYEIMFLIGDVEMKRYSYPEQQQLFQRFASVVHEALPDRAKSADRAVMLPSILFMAAHGFITHYIHSNKSFDEVAEKAHEHVHFLCRGLA